MGIKNPDEKLIILFAIDAIRRNVKKLKREYGDVVICCDNKKYWRKEVFPFYKASRKVNREKSQLDWNLIFKSLNNLKNDLREHFPYKVLDVDGAEADDVIAVLAKIHHKNEKIVICSKDADYKQLQKYDNVKQYDPKTGIFIKSNDVHKELKEKIIRGDSGDGITNILSQDDCLVIKKRQTAISSKKIEEWVNQTPEQFCNEDMLSKYNRNLMLIDFEYIPSYIQEGVMQEFSNEVCGSKSKIYKYFIENNMIDLLEIIEDF